MNRQPATPLLPLVRPVTRRHPRWQKNDPRRRSNHLPLPVDTTTAQPLPALLRGRIGHRYRREDQHPSQPAAAITATSQLPLSPKQEQPQNGGSSLGSPPSPVQGQNGGSSRGSPPSLARGQNGGSSQGSPPSPARGGQTVRSHVVLVITTLHHRANHHHLQPAMATTVRLLALATATTTSQRLAPATATTAQRLPLATATTAQLLVPLMGLHRPAGQAMTAGQVWREREGEDHRGGGDPDAPTITSLTLRWRLGNGASHLNCNQLPTPGIIRNKQLLPRIGLPRRSCKQQLTQNGPHSSCDRHHRPLPPPPPPARCGQDL